MRGLMETLMVSHPRQNQEPPSKNHQLMQWSWMFSMLSGLLKIAFISRAWYNLSSQTSKYSNSFLVFQQSFSWFSCKFAINPGLIQRYSGYCAVFRSAGLTIIWQAQRVSHLGSRSTTVIDGVHGGGDRRMRSDQNPNWSIQTDTERSCRLAFLLGPVRTYGAL